MDYKSTKAFSIDLFGSGKFLISGSKLHAKSWDMILPFCYIIVSLGYWTWIVRYYLAGLFEFVDLFLIVLLLNGTNFILEILLVVIEPNESSMVLFLVCDYFFLLNVGTGGFLSGFLSYMLYVWIYFTV